MLMYVKDAIILEQFEDTCLVFDYYLYCIFTYASDDSNGEAVKEHIISSLQLASAALSPTFSPIQSSKHSKSTPVHSKCFKPLTIDCTDGNKLTDAADNLPGSNQPLNVTCTKVSCFLNIYTLFVLLSFLEFSVSSNLLFFLTSKC